MTGAIVAWTEVHAMFAAAARDAGIGVRHLRAADLLIKENKKLILVPREAPFSALHLENMLKLARLGVVILPRMRAR